MVLFSSSAAVVLFLASYLESGVTQTEAWITTTTTTSLSSREKKSRFLIDEKRTTASSPSIPVVSSSPQQWRRKHLLLQQQPWALSSSSSSLENNNNENESSSPSSSVELPLLTMYNSKSRQKEAIKPLVPGKASMYTCGPTVYDYAHVGNFRAFLTYDLLKRVLLYFGYDVTHICNLTDVDDKIIKRANEQNLEDVRDLTLRFEERFLNDLRALNCILATKYPRATEHIPEMMEMISILHHKGLSYETPDGSWYFRTSKQEGYGKQLVNIANQDDLLDNNEEDFAQEKENPQDFCLWKAFKPGVDRDDMAWEYDPQAQTSNNKNEKDDDGSSSSTNNNIVAFRKGRPGWHLECSAMARKYLGDTIDYHGGGVDLKFPHHENEIAQSEGTTGQMFCQCWFHNGFVNIGDEKMSKSLGNFLTLRTACPNDNDVRAYRYLVISSQYRNPLSFTSQALQASKNALKRIDKCKAQIEELLASSSSSTTSSSGSSSAMKDFVAKAMSNFETAILDDLSMPRASASFFSLVKAAEKELKKPDPDLVGLKEVHSAMERMNDVFGIFYEVPKQEEDEDEEDEEEIPSEVLDMVRDRTAAKNDKDWELADSLRSRIEELGYVVKDVKGGGPPLVSPIEGRTTPQKKKTTKKKENEIPSEVLDMVRDRTAAKNDKDWELADSLRSRIEELGYVVKDVKGGGPPIVSPKVEVEA